MTINEKFNEKGLEEAQCAQEREEQSLGAVFGQKS